MGQIAQQLNNRPLGTLPEDTENNPRSEENEHAKVVTLRSGKELSKNPEIVYGEKTITKDEQLNKKESEDETKEKEKTVEEPIIEAQKGTLSSIVPPIPFPKRLQKKRLDKQFVRFLEVFKKLHINILFAEALKQMPSYVKFMKEVLLKKKRLGYYEIVALTEGCSAILQHEIPPKLKDPGSFTIPCKIGQQFSVMALCDLGESINLMPLLVFRKLGVGECKPTSVTLQVADLSLTKPKGVMEDILVKVEKFIFPADFLILDMEEDAEIPIILGRPFLATGRALIDVQLVK